MDWPTKSKDFPADITKAALDALPLFVVARHFNVRVEEFLPSHRGVDAWDVTLSYILHDEWQLLALNNKHPLKRHMRILEVEPTKLVVCSMRLWESWNIRRKGLQVL